MGKRDPWNLSNSNKRSLKMVGVGLIIKNYNMNHLSIFFFRYAFLSRKVGSIFSKIPTNQLHEVTKNCAPARADALKSIEEHLKDKTKVSFVIRRKTHSNCFS